MAGDFWVFKLAFKNCYQKCSWPFWLETWVMQVATKILAYHETIRVVRILQMIRNRRPSSAKPCHRFHLLCTHWRIFLVREDEGSQASGTERARVHSTGAGSLRGSLWLLGRWSAVVLVPFENVGQSLASTIRPVLEKQNEYAYAVSLLWSSEWIRWRFVNDFMIRHRITSPPYSFPLGKKFLFQVIQKSKVHNLT